ncbi:TRAP transporter small permease [Exilibacterium tricleocarpae]|uniref:TRAP transporter small permease protein n=1 Tax=Exilibacterium tricleocarpae TaxID=2591008 RepID=A0A545SRZ2_9GAMM|nr:TRAP transporter small permease [Exilibacterium tricleocarpae]TQV67737.1 TRAP transporter small permease [Exilibacterium tricleocarpae]
MIELLYKHLVTPLATLNHTVSVYARNLAAILVLLMTSAVLIQVLFRYVLNDSLSWTEEFAKVMMVWTAFLVAPWAYRRGQNVSINIFSEAMSRPYRLVLQIGLNLLVLWIVYVLFIESLAFWSRGQSIQSATMGIEMAWFYSVVPFGFSALFLVGCELVLRDLLALIDGGDYRVPDAEGNLE